MLDKKPLELAPAGRAIADVTPVNMSAMASITAKSIFVFMVILPALRMCSKVMLDGGFNYEVRRLKDAKNKVDPENWTAR